MSTIATARDAEKFPFQLDETGSEESDLRVVRVNDDNEVVGDFIITQTDDGDVLVVCRRFDEAQFGSVNFVLV